MERKTFSTRNYDLGATLNSGQSFRWKLRGDSWVGVIGSNWVRLTPTCDGFTAETTSDAPSWDWLTHYLQLDLDLDKVLATFPNDPAMNAAVKACRGLRLLRQEPWETLASFILSSTKQIVQIRQIHALLCERFGEKIATPAGYEVAYSFPTAETLSQISEADLRDCKMGFRAPYLLRAAQAVHSKSLVLDSLHELTLDEARLQFTKLHGVGAKIADCVLLFAYHHPKAFPVDVWVMKALRELYFPKRKPSTKRLQYFIENHFGPQAGYAQQYLFHYMRTQRQTLASAPNLPESR